MSPYSQETYMVAEIDVPRGTPAMAVTSTTTGSTTDKEGYRAVPRRKKTENSTVVTDAVIQNQNAITLGSRKTTSDTDMAKLPRGK